MKQIKICLLMVGGLFTAGFLQGATLIEYNFDQRGTWNPTEITTASSYDDQSGNGHTVKFNRISDRYANYPFSASEPSLEGFDYSGRTRFAADTNGSVNGVGSITLNRTFTLEGWVYAESYAQYGSSSILWSVNATKNNSGANATSTFSLSYTADGTIRARFYSQGANAYNLDANVSLELNTWTHLAYVKKSNAIEIYVNGVLAGSYSSSGTTDRALPKDLSSIVVASNIYGAFDDFRFSNTALSPENLGYHSPFTVIPEPSTTALLFFGVAGGWMMARRRQRVNG